MWLNNLPGWESQLLETGFLAIFMCPLFSLRQLPRFTPTNWVVIWGYRWLLFRIMMGAVSVKFPANIPFTIVHTSNTVCAGFDQDPW